MGNVVGASISGTSTVALAKPVTPSPPFTT